MFPSLGWKNIDHLVHCRRQVGEIAVLERCRVGRIRNQEGDTCGYAIRVRRITTRSAQIDDKAACRPVVEKECLLDRQSLFDISVWYVTVVKIKYLPIARCGIERVSFRNIRCRRKYK